MSRDRSIRRRIHRKLEHVPRRRRSPEVARQELLDAAERVFAEAQPDQVGLKDVARAAGTSHALITHYFGTYAGLIEAALERRVRALRERIFEQLRVPGALARPETLIDQLFDALENPVHLRLMKWLVASERPGAAHAFALQERGLVLVAAQVAAALDPKPSPELRHAIELTLLTAVAAAFGYAASKQALAGALGRESTRELDGEVRRTLAGMIQAYVRTHTALPTPA